MKSGHERANTVVWIRVGSDGDVCRSALPIREAAVTRLISPETVQAGLKISLCLRSQGRRFAAALFLIAEKHQVWISSRDCLLGTAVRTAQNTFDSIDNMRHQVGINLYFCAQSIWNHIRRDRDCRRRLIAKDLGRYMRYFFAIRTNGNRLLDGIAGVTSLRGDPLLTVFYCCKSFE